MNFELLDKDLLKIINKILVQEKPLSSFKDNLYDLISDELQTFRYNKIFNDIKIFNPYETTLRANFDDARFSDMLSTIRRILGSEVFSENNLNNKIELLTWISLFPPLRFERGRGRKFYIYSPFACETNVFNRHRISNFGKMNDPFEIISLYQMLCDHSLCGTLNEILKDRCSGKILISCTTDKFKSNYFNKMYSKSTGCYVSMNKSSAYRNFDSLFVSNELLPIRGYVRYGSTGKNEYLDAVRSYCTSKSIKEIIFYLYSLFVKNEVMNIESEYRFILLLSKPNINYLTTNTELKLEPRITITTSFSPSEVVAKEYYDKNATKEHVCSFNCTIDENHR